MPPVSSSLIFQSIFKSFTVPYSDVEQSMSVFTEGQRSDNAVKLPPVWICSVVNLQKLLLDGTVMTAIDQQHSVPVWSMITPQSCADHREFSRIRAAKRITSWLCEHFV